MRILLIILVVLVLLLVLVLALGALAPKRHTTRSQARYQQSPQVIWDTITDFRAFPTWRRDVKSVEPLPEHNGLPAWREHGANGDIPFEVIESQPPHRLVTRITDPKLPFGGTWTYEIKPDGTGTILTITENGEVYNPVFRFVSHYLIGNHVTMDRYLRALGRKVNEDVIPNEVH